MTFPSCKHTFVDSRGKFLEYERRGHLSTWVRAPMLSAGALEWGDRGGWGQHSCPPAGLFGRGNGEEIQSLNFAHHFLHCEASSLAPRHILHFITAAFVGVPSCYTSKINKGATSVTTSTLIFTQQ